MCRPTPPPKALDDGLLVKELGLSESFGEIRHIGLDRRLIRVLAALSDDALHVLLLVYPDPIVGDVLGNVGASTALRSRSPLVSALSRSSMNPASVSSVSLILSSASEANRRDQTERQMRSCVRAQMRNALVIDASILLNNLRQRDQEQIFRSKDRDHKEQAEMAGDDKERTETWKVEHREAIEVEPGVAALLAFLYEGLEERSMNQRMGDFEDVLRSAMERVAKKKGWEVDTFQFTVEFDSDPGFEVMKDRFNDSEATIKEATTLVRHDLISTEEFAEYINSEEFTEHVNSR